MTTYKLSIYFVPQDEPLSVITGLTEEQADALQALIVKLGAPYDHEFEMEES